MIEVISTRRLETTAKAQCLSYMKLMNLPLGLVVNFGDLRLGHSGIARVILKGASTPDV